MAIHTSKLRLSLAGCVVALASCGGSDDQQPAVVIDAGTPNTVSRWDEAAVATINQPNSPTGTPEEVQSVYAVDLATVHVAMYDAAVAIEGHYRPLYATPSSPTTGASVDVAIAAAAYGVLKGLFPTRAASYQAAYDAQLASVPDDMARQRGIDVGAEVAAGVLAARANDGRATPLATFAAGTGPGEFRGPAIVGRSYPFIRPFLLSSASQFRPAQTPALTSAAYAADYNETRSLGGSTSTARTQDQATTATFHTETPFTFWPKNLRPFTMGKGDLVEQARLGAVLWVTHADATIACFEAKYHFLAWRPFSAINAGDSDGNDATVADPDWKPFLPTPPHPEYPAAHACVGGAAAEAMRLYFGTQKVGYDFTSSASASSHHYDGTDDLVADITVARIAGGMHFRSSINDGVVLGTSVSNWAMSHAFQAR